MLRRSRARFFGVLALAAIALQLALSFGHSHAGAGHLAGFEAASVNCIDNTGASCPAPADHDRQDATCLICLAASQAAATVLARPLDVARPEATAPAFKRLPSVPTHDGTDVANFFARGPPRA
jgi:hypothetical protein